jgi:acetyltransferase-like isoleucine patch superfamily enzyme
MSSPVVGPDLLLLPEDIEFDPSVIIGYRPGRRVADLSLRVGPRARLRSGTVIYAGSTIGADFQTGHNVVVREQNALGDHVQIWNNTTVDYGCRIGDRVKIHANCYVAQFTVLEDDVFMAPGVTIANDVHPGCAFSGECMRGPVLKRGVQVGVNVTIVPMITIGEYSVIGSGAVVTRDVPPRSLVTGNPGRITKRVDELACRTGVAPGGYSYRPYLHAGHGSQGAEAGLPLPHSGSSRTE